MNFTQVTKSPALRRLLALPPPAVAGEHDTEDDERQDGATKAPSGRAVPLGKDFAPSRQTPWERVEEGSGAHAGRRVGRVLIWSLIVLLVLLGLRSLFAGGKVQQVIQPAPVSTFPTGQASAVAQRFTQTYLTTSTDQDAQAARLASLALDSPVDFTRSWNGTGTQSVAQVIPGQVTVSDDRNARVQVLVQIATPAPPSAPATTPAPTTPAPAKPAPKASAPKKPALAPLAAPTIQLAADSTSTSAPTWLAMTVPVQVSGSRVVVSAVPAFTDLPAAGPVTVPRTRPQQDDALTAQTRGSATAFFQAWAGNDGTRLAAATAPGAKFTPLGAPVAFSQLTGWSVNQDTAPTPSASSSATPSPTPTGSAQTRTALGTVSWTLPSGAVLSQSYTVTLRAVAGGGITDWRVAQATVATTEGATS